MIFILSLLASQAQMTASFDDAATWLLTSWVLLLRSERWYLEIYSTIPFQSVHTAVWYTHHHQGALITKVKVNVHHQLKRCSF